MVKSFLTVFLLCAVAVSANLRANDSVVVHVTVEGFRNVKGACRFLLFESPKGFPESPADAVMVLTEMIDGGTVHFSFKVKPGSYAFAVLHDENLNGRMDKTWYGKPKEGFGTSGKPPIGSSPPRFEESKILLDGRNDTLGITLTYF